MVMKKDEIVITGASCRLPESSNLEEFKNHLFNKDDLITEDERRWPLGYYGLPTRHGKIKNVSAFDAAFFGVSPKQANMMDPQLRILLEVAHEAILDAGLNPSTFRGSNTGVFVGCSSTETQDVLIQDPERIQGYSLTGCQHSMFANRLSFSFDFKGPSFSVDTACSSSLLAFQLAVDSIKQGNCDSALVCGTHLTLRPASAMQFMKLGMLSPQGKCQTFDANVDGYVRSEGIVAVLLQRESDAQRIYAEVIHAKSSTDGFKEQGITYPNGQEQASLLRRIYTEACIDPADVLYVECHGTGTKVGDPQEANAVTDVLCQNRTTPLLVGSVKSNMGHAEPASGLASICKMIVAMNEGYIPPNLHFREPNPNIPALLDGRMKVVTEKTPFDEGIFGINSFGFGGANTHVILRARPKFDAAKAKAVTEKSPKILTYAGRTVEALDQAFDYFESKKCDEALYTLFNKHNLQSASNFPYRGYMLYNRKDDSAPAIREIQKVPSNDKHPIWFVYSGMGTHYTGMGKELMSIDIFEKTIRRCAQPLKQYNVDPYDLIMNGGSDGIYCAVCICAIQIALTETLKHLGIEPDGILGHSFGEMAAGFGDGCMGLTETMLCAYYRTLSIVEQKFDVPGAMAAVGLTWEEAKTRCPPGVVAACHNAKDSVTISGSKDLVTKFVEQLKEEGVFAKEVNSVGIAFHSECMGICAKPMKDRLEKIIKEPRKRSPKWISTSVPESKWNTPLGQYCSADYHVNNAVSPVLFYEALQHVPENSVLIEISPHCLLQAILRRCVSSTCRSVGLLKARHENNLEFFLQNIGKIYASGLPLKADLLFKPQNIKIPMQRGTPILSPAINWDHSQSWLVIGVDSLVVSAGGAKPTSATITVDAYNNESEEKYMIDHCIDGRVLYPFAGHVVLAWKMFCKLRGLDYIRTPVVIENMSVFRATILSQTPIKLDINFTMGTGFFEILEGDQVAASGNISLPEGSTSPVPDLDEDETHKFPIKDKFTMTGAEVYKELRLRGYEYGPQFRPIQRASDDCMRTEIAFNDNFVPFIDALLQAYLVTEKRDTLQLPVRLRYLAIDAQKHFKCVQKNKENVPIINTVTSAELRQCLAGGILLRDLFAQTVARRPGAVGKLVVEKSFFIPFFDDDCLSGHWPEMAQRLQRYQNACRSAVIAVLKNLDNAGVKIPNATALSDITKKEKTSKSLDEKEVIALTAEKDAHLLRFLSKLCKLDFKDKATLKELPKTLEEGFENLYSDALHASIYKEPLIKPMLDLVTENTSGHFIKACHLEPCEPHTAKICREIQTLQPLLEVDWTLCGPDVDQLDADQITLCGGLTQHKLSLDDAAKPPKEDSYDVLLVDRVLHRKADPSAYLSNAARLLRPDGFAIVCEVTGCHELQLATLALRGQTTPTTTNGRQYGAFYTREQWTAQFECAGFDVVARRSASADAMITAFLLRRRQTPDVATTLTIAVDDASEFSWLEPLKKAIDNDNQRIWLTSTTTPDAGTVGLGLCLRAELSKNRIRTLVDLSLKKESKTLDLNSKETKSVMAKDLHSNIYRDGVWGSFRHIPVKEDEQHNVVETEHAYINTLVPGDLGSLTWVQSPNDYLARQSGSADRRLVQVHYTALNFRDIMLATGRLSGDAIPGDFADRECLLGLEYAGRWYDKPDAKPVMGLAPAQALATTVLAEKRFTWPVPAGWTMEQAATAPVAYTTAYYALVIRGKIRKGEKVLIHAGSGGVGQAAIAVALSYGCEVYTTVSSDEKRRFLQQRFPKSLPDNRFANSRTCDFEQHILAQTKGRGVDAVLNSLAEDKLQASVRCLAQHGRFLEIGKVDLSNNTQLGMAIFLKNASFHGILLDALFGNDCSEWSNVAELFERGLKDGVVKPLATTVFPADKATEAFRYMAQGKHIGKVLLKVRPDDHCPAVPLKVKAVRRTLCDPDCSYIITGGLGGFGLELANWLVKRGARKLVLTSRAGIKTGYQNRYCSTWTKNDVKVLISKADISKVKGSDQLIQEAKSLGPVAGLFHLAMVLRDNLFENQTVQNFKESAEAKYWGTKNLDQSTRRLCGAEFKHFVVFSSISNGRGNAGQTNYGWTNSTMERVMEMRKEAGFPGMAVQWGAIGDVGVILEHMGDNTTVIGGTLPQRMPSCLATLDLALNWADCGSAASSYVRAETTRSGGDAAASGVDATTAVAQIMGVQDPAAIDANAQFGDLGLDSLMGVEIKQALERNYGLTLSAKEIRSMTLNKLREAMGGAKGKGKDEKINKVEKVSKSAIANGSVANGH